MSTFALGLSPFAPGTCGTLLGVLIHIATSLLAPENLRFGILLAAFLLACLANNLFAPRAVAYWGTEDPKHFVWDEVAGYLLVPVLFHHGKTWQVALWGFLFFRLFDIVKIPPASQIDSKLGGAWGILLDDLVSACYAVIVLYILWLVGPYAGVEAWLISG